MFWKWGKIRGKSTDTSWSFKITLFDSILISLPTLAPRCGQSMPQNVLAVQFLFLLLFFYCIILKCYFQLCIFMCIYVYVYYYIICMCILLYSIFIFVSHANLFVFLILKSSASFNIQLNQVSSIGSLYWFFPRRSNGTVWILMEQFPLPGLFVVAFICDFF